MPTPDQIDHLYAQLQALIADLARRGFNVGVDSYCAVYALLVSLAGRGVLSDDFGALRRLIAPILCSSPQEQAEFYRLFDERFSAPVLAAKMEQAVQIRQYQEQQRHGLIAAFVAILLVLPALLIGGVFLRPVENLPAPQTQQAPIKTTTDTITVSSVPSTPMAISTPPATVAQQPPEPEPQKAPPTQLAFWLMLALFLATLLWYVVPYLKAKRFLTRHQVSEPPELDDFFLKNPVKAFSSVAFAHTAQQLHKHRDLDAQLLDVATTVKRSIAAGGQFTPAYQAIKALPEYLVLIDRASYHDQLSAFVQSLLQELQDFGLFIEKYYFDRDPRRCYAERTPAVPCRLDALQARYPNHRLIIFSDSRHFFDPIHGKPYPWLEKFHEWQQNFLFTTDSPWDYYKQQLHHAGFVVLTTGQQGLASLVNHIAQNAIQATDHAAEHYPALLQQRPLRFIERHAPDDETIAELRQQLLAYLQQDGLNWLAACAVYPELHWQLTLYLGQARDVEPLPVDANLFARLSTLAHAIKNRANKFAPTKTASIVGWVERSEAQQNHAVNVGLRSRSTQPTDGKLNEALLLKLARLPWLRHGYMPDWLRLALLHNLAPAAEQTIRAQLAELLKTMLHGQAAQAQDLTLAIAQQSQSKLLKHLLPAWWKRSETLSQDYVFQSFMAGRLAVDIKFSNTAAIELSVELRKFIIKISSITKATLKTLNLSLYLWFAFTLSLKPYGNNLLTPATHNWIVFVGFTVGVLALFEGLSWGYIGGSVFGGDSLASWLFGLLLGIGFFIFEWGVAVSLMSLDSETYKTHSSPKAVNDMGDVGLDSADQTESINGWLWNFIKWPGFPMGIRILLLVTPIFFTTSSISMYVLKAEIENELSKRLQISYDLVKKEKLQSIAVQLHKREQSERKVKTDIQVQLDAWKRAQYESEREVSGASGSRQVGRGSIAHFKQTQADNFKLKYELARQRLENLEKIHSQPTQASKELAKLEDARKEKKFDVLREDFGILDVPDSLLARRMVMRELLNSRPDLRRVSDGIYALLVMLGCSLLLLKFFQPASVGIYFSEKRQSHWHHYKQGGYDYLLSEKNKSTHDSNLTMTPFYFCQLWDDVIFVATRKRDYDYAQSLLRRM